MQSRMTMLRYQKSAMRTSPEDGHDRVENGVLGLIGETGELVDLYKKYRFQSGEAAKLPAKKFAEELGDVLWYLAELAEGMGEELIAISDKDFDALDARFSEPGGRSQDLKRLLTQLSWRANRLNRVADGWNWRGLPARRGGRDHTKEEMRIQIRRMLAGAARIAWKIGYSLEEVASMNVRKLEKRYPQGFDPKISMARYGEER